MKIIKFLASGAALLLVILMSASLSAASFADTSGHWGEAYISEAADSGLFMGDGNGNFNPDGTVTRAQLVTVLWRMADSPKAETMAPFSDIENQNSDFKSAISWAFEKGYINGISDTLFDPDGVLTREAAMKILFNHSGAQSGEELMYTAIYDKFFADSDKVSEWAKSGMYWGIYNEMILGVGDNTLSPGSGITRAQLAKIITVYIKMNIK